MPLTRNQQLGVAVGVAAGAGFCLGLGGLALYQGIGRKTTGYSEFARELASLRKELEALRAQLTQNQRRGLDVPDQITVVDSNLLERQIRRVASYSSDDSLEYYDAIDDFETIEVGPSVTPSQLFRTVESLLDGDTDEQREQAYELMKPHYAHNSENVEFLWRLARVTYLYGQTFVKVNESRRKELCFEAKDYAFEAENLESNDGEVQKWCALTLGAVTDFLSLNDKIKTGYEFKLHIDHALELKPDDPILHHLRSRWCYSVAELSWIERKVAAALFSEPPTSTYDEALRGFLESERLQPNKWTENVLYIAKCYIQLKDVDSALPYLEIALRLIPTSSDDKLAKEEASFMMSKYKKDN